MNHSPTFYRYSALRRAVERYTDDIAKDCCSCAGCPKHKGPCPFESTAQRPLAMHTYKGQRLCSRCVNALLEVNHERLFPEICR